MKLIFFNLNKGEFNGYILSLQTSSYMTAFVLLPAKNTSRVFFSFFGNAQVEADQINPGDSWCVMGWIIRDSCDLSP